MDAAVGVQENGVAADEPGPVWPVPRFVESSLGRFDQRWLTAWIVGVAAVVAFLIRWTQDDSFISLRYARNLVEGNGLVFNPGDNVEGYTNFLWTMLMTIPLKLGRDPVLFGHFIGIASMVVTLLMTIAIANRVFDSKVLGNFTALILLTNSTFIIYATGGLETQLQTALVMSVWLLAIPALMQFPSMRTDRPYRTLELFVLSLVSGLALLTRLDSALLVVIPAAAVFWAVLRSGRQRDSSGPQVSRKQLALNLVALVVPVLVMVVWWTVWRLDTYGSFVPNTAVAKANTLRVSILQGLSFLFFFLLLNLLFAFVPAALIRGREVLARQPFVAISAALALWVLYLLKVGGDFMEFRFMVAVLPLIALMLVALISLTRSEFWKMVMVCSLAVGAVLHLVVLGANGGIANIDSNANLYAYVTDPDSGEAVMGQELRSVLNGSAEAEQPGSGAVIIATGAAGAIPYFARLRTIDTLGLNDWWTARHGLVIDSEAIPKPGHTRVATVAYMKEQDVNLSIIARGQPKPDGYDMDDFLSIFLEAEPDLEQLLLGATMIEIPMRDGTVYPALYLKRHPDIDAAVRAGRWNEVPLNR